MRVTRVHPWGLYVDSRDVARLVGWRTQRIQRIWVRLGIAKKIGRSVVTTRHQLREQFPEQWEEILDWLDKNVGK